MLRKMKDGSGRYFDDVTSEIFDESILAMGKHVNNTNESKVIIIPADHSANITDNKVKRNNPKKNRDVYFSMSILEAKNLNLTESELAFYAKASWNIDYEKPYLLNDDGTPMLLKDMSKFMGWGVKGTKAGDVLKSLEEKGVVYRENYGGRNCKRILLNPRYLWRGHLSKQKPAVKSFDELWNSKKAHSDV